MLEVDANYQLALQLSGSVKLSQSLSLRDSIHNAHFGAAIFRGIGHSLMSLLISCSAIPALRILVFLEYADLV